LQMYWKKLNSLHITSNATARESMANRQWQI